MSSWIDPFSVRISFTFLTSNPITSSIAMTHAVSLVTVNNRYRELTLTVVDKIPIKQLTLVIQIDWVILLSMTRAQVQTTQTPRAKFILVGLFSTITECKCLRAAVKYSGQCVHLSDIIYCFECIGLPSHCDMKESIEKTGAKDDSWYA